MTKVMTLVGTRPELIKMSRVIAELDLQLEHVLVHSGQNFDYELNEVFFKDLEIRKPDYFLNANGDSAMETIANVLQKFDEVLEKENPSALLIYGDTNTGLAVIAAKRKKIPIFHMEAGNRCFDQRVPEELNRKVIDHLSDINMVLTEHARRYLIAEGIKPETIIKTGSHMEEILDYYLPKISSSKVLAQLGLKEKEYFLVSVHREENVDSETGLYDLVDSLEQLESTYKIPVIISTHPRTRKKLEFLNLNSDNKNLHFVKPFGFIDYLSLQKNARCVISDSGTITEEASLLNIPAITLRNSHERPEGMDEGTLVMSNLKSQDVLEAINVVTNQYSSIRPMSRVKDYEGGQVSKKIVRIVLSYINYINRTVWFKSN